jgi:farnesyl-diphosphate farnesyltransferase
MPESLTDLLQQTSRSFYLTLRVLPGAVRPQIGLAYLLARTADTIADTDLVSVEERLAALQKLRQRIRGESGAALNFGELARHQGSSAERVLLERSEESLAALQALPPDDAQHIRTVLETITSGQELDLRRFAGASADNVLALQTDADLDDYTYRVAGCVGEFWTRMCRAHLFPRAKLDDTQLLTDGVRFGKGLQLVNILRDLPADLRQGRCYLPAERLAVAGLRPADLLDPSNEPKLRPLYHEYLDRALGHLAAGWAYTNALPRGQMRVRLACAWPILIGGRTLERLRQANPLDGTRRVKASRAEVRGIILRSLWRYPSRTAWAGQFPAGLVIQKGEGNAVASRGDLP